VQGKDGSLHVVSNAGATAVQFFAALQGNAHEAGRQAGEDRHGPFCVSAGGAAADSLVAPRLSVGAPVLLCAGAALSVGVLGLAVTLVFRTFFDDADQIQNAQAYSLALISVGVAASGVTLWRRQREARGSR